MPGVPDDRKVIEAEQLSSELVKSISFSAALTASGASHAPQKDRLTVDPSSTRFISYVNGLLGILLIAIIGFGVASAATLLILGSSFTPHIVNTGKGIVSLPSGSVARKMPPLSASKELSIVEEKGAVIVDEGKIAEIQKQEKAPPDSLNVDNSSALSSLSKQSQSSATASLPPPSDADFTDRLAAGVMLALLDSLISRKVAVNITGFQGDAQVFCKNESTKSPFLKASVKGYTDHRGTAYLFRCSETELPTLLPGQVVKIIINGVMDNHTPRLSWWAQGLNIESLEVRNLMTNDELTLRASAHETFDNGSLPLEPGIKSRITIKGQVKNSALVTCPCYDEARIQYLQGLILEQVRAGDSVGESCTQTSYSLNSNFPAQTMSLRAPRVNGTLSCELEFHSGDFPILDVRDDLTPDEVNACQNLLSLSCLDS